MTGERGSLRVDGGELYYEVAGEGRALILLHDGLLDGRVWDGCFEAFSRLYRTVRYDRRGYGRSSTPRGPFSDVADLECLLRFLAMDEVCLVGVSNGGKVALEFALEHPGAVEAMVLVGSGLDGYRISEEKERRLAGIFALTRERGVVAGVEAWLEDPFYPPVREKTAAREKLRLLASENMPRLLAAPGLRTGPASPVARSLSRIVAPTLILVGERDDGDNQSISSLLERELPHATKRVVAGAGHLVNLEAPEVFERYVRRWLDGPDAPAGRF